jgi:hypothetical protein
MGAGISPKLKIVKEKESCDETRSKQHRKVF